jgi:hypothetical protein
MRIITKSMERIKTKTGIIISAVILGVSGLGVILPLSASAANCTPTGFMRDGINMTAAIVNPSSTVSGDVDASGCNVGVYYGPGTKGTVNNANVHGANYYGVVVQKAKVTVENSNVHNIGETPLNGSQHGVGIYYATITGQANGDCSSGSTKGTVNNNSVSSYQKGGIVVACTGSDVDVTNNNVEGQGPVNYIAQNGIQMGYGAQGEVGGNIVTGNSYTGAGQAASGGILVVGGACYGGDYTTSTDIDNNIVIGNDVGVYVSNLDAACGPASTKTKVDVDDNTISNASLNNQAGVSDQGDKDKITDNRISGAGYNPNNSNASISTTYVDVSATNHAKVHANKYR